MKDRKRNRKLGFDYSTEAIYFLTICSKNRIHYFGKIENNKMILNEYGKITDTQIQWLEQQYPYFILHNYIIMPNHVHILCEISTNQFRTDSSRAVPTTQPVPTERAVPTEQSAPIRKIKSISELMGAFKTTSSKKIHLAGNDLFKWQRSFHDHIVRNDYSYQNIYNYITQNPEKWVEDTYNK